MSGIQMLPRKALQAGMRKGRCAAPVFSASRSDDNVQASTRQPSRAEMLKSRFAETILKARPEIQDSNKSHKTPSQMKSAAGASASRTIKALQAGMRKDRCAAPVFSDSRSDDYVQASTRQASRAEMLKSRFAETILKARLEIQDSNKSHKTPSQIKSPAGASASRTTKQYSLQMRRYHKDRKASRMEIEKARHRDRQRRAARMALQKMEKTVEVDRSAASILKDLEILFGQPVGTGYPDAKQLEKIGLYMKEDHEERKTDGMEIEKARHRDRQRRAARMALRKMEKTVEVDKSAASILKDLEILFGQPVPMGYPDAKQLEKLGLHRKEDHTYLEEDEDTNMELEEREIPS